jgi:ABC-type nitrate/sulfonate/bicarbonate transport system substrate-binding protein
MVVRIVRRFRGSIRGAGRALACAALVVAAVLAAVEASAATNVVITYASFSEREGVLFVAKEHDFFKKYGLDVDMIYVATGSVALSALSRGSSQFNTGSASGATLGAIAGGSDVAFIAGLVNKLTGTFVVSPQIGSPAELKNKRLAVTSIGGGTWVFTMLALQHWGLDPKRDNISIRVVGNDAVRAQALSTGAVDGAVVGYAFASTLKQQGFRILADLADLGIPFQGTAVLSRRSFVTQSPDVVEKVLRALVDAIAFIQAPANKEAVTRTLAKSLHLQRQEDAAQGYERMKGLYDKRIFPTAEGIRNTMRLFDSNEKIRQLKVEDVIDDRMVRKLEKEGVF